MTEETQKTQIENSNETASKTVSTVALYDFFYKSLELNPRTLHWYATEGLIPKPTKKGREAYYHLAKTQVKPRIYLIYTLQKKFDLHLWQIKRIVNNYEKQDLSTLLSLLNALHENYPKATYDKHGLPRHHGHNTEVQNLFVQKITEGVPLDRLSIIEIEKEIDDRPLDETVPF